MPDQPEQITIVDPSLVEDFGPLARLDYDPDVLADLTASIEAHGQQVPILLRPHPDAAGRFQVAYGRRRLFALIDLGRNARAVVRDMDDAQMLIAQGQENTARQDPSFLDRAYFAHALAEAGHDRPTIMAALHADATTVSRMITVVATISPGVARVIGSVDGIGRDRWMALTRMWPNGEDRDDFDARFIAQIIATHDVTHPDDRFEAVWSWALRRRGVVPVGAGPKGRMLDREDGGALCILQERRRTTSVTFARGAMGEFADWLVDNLPELHAAWARAEEPGQARAGDAGQAGR